MSDHQSMNLWNYYGILYRYKFRVAAVMVIAVALGFVWIAYAPREYESEAKLFVRVGWESAGLDPTVNKVDAVAINISRETEIITMLEHLRSRPILESVMNVVVPPTPGESPESREKAFAGFKSRLSITSPKNSMVIRIAAKGDSPQQAQKAASVLTNLYLDDHLALSRPAGSYEFLAEQSKRLREEFEDAQNELRDAKNQGDLASILGRRTALESQINVLQTKITEVTASLSAIDAKMSAMRNTFDSLDKSLLRQMVSGSPNDGFAAMRNKLFELQVRQEELRAKYQVSHPLYKAVENQVEELTAALKQEEPDREQIIEAISAADLSSRASLIAQKQSMQNQLVGLRDELLKLNEGEIQVSRSEVKLRHAEARYLAYATKTEDARIDNALLKDKISNVQVIQPASMVALPVGPQKTSILLLALVFGLVGGVATALLSHQFACWLETNGIQLSPRRTQGASSPVRRDSKLRAGVMPG
jgi:polysaccharide biosynthesis protein PslE